MRFGCGAGRVPVGQVVVVGVAVIQEAAFLAHQAASVRPGTTGVPTLRALASQFGEDADGFEHMLALFGFAHVLVVDPAVAMAADLVTGGGQPPAGLPGAPGGPGP